MKNWGEAVGLVVVGLVIAIFMIVDESKKNSSHSATQQASVHRPGLGRSYADITEGLERYFPRLEASVLANGEARQMGQSRHGAAILEIVGDFPSDAARASLTFFATSDSPEMNITSIAIAGQFVKNIFPDWDRGPRVVVDELLKLPKNVRKDGSAKSELTYGDKRIELSFAKQLGMFSVAIAKFTGP